MSGDPTTQTSVESATTSAPAVAPPTTATAWAEV